MTHFLDRTDPTFVQDLLDSDCHVKKLVRTLNYTIQSIRTTPTEQQDFDESIVLEAMKVKIRDSAKNRKKFSDDGDVKCTRTWKGRTTHAMVEVKQRKTPMFKNLDEFKYENVIVDTLKNFNKIRLRGDTLGYVLTNNDSTCIFFVPIDVLAKNYIIRKGYRNSRSFDWVTVPKELCIETPQRVVDTIQTLMRNHTPPTTSSIHSLKVEKIKRTIHTYDTRIEELTKSLELAQTCRSNFKRKLNELLDTKDLSESVDSPKPLKPHKPHNSHGPIVSSELDQPQLRRSKRIKRIKQMKQI